MALKFFWNGIKDNGGRLQRVFYSAGPFINHPAGTLTIYKRGYAGFSAGVREAFTVANNSEGRLDYLEPDTIRVEPSHPLHAAVLGALQAGRDRAARLRWNGPRP
jgi:hypothetical protein